MLKSCWIDDMGDTLEAEGVNPGRIFEWREFAFPKCEPGGIVVTNEVAAPGQCPQTIGDLLIYVKEIIVRERHPTGFVIHRLKPNNPTCLKNWLGILGAQPCDQLRKELEASLLGENTHPLHDITPDWKVVTARSFFNGVKHLRYFGMAYMPDPFQSLTLEWDPKSGWTKWSLYPARVKAGDTFTIPDAPWRS